MRKVAHIHIPRNAGTVMQWWGRQYAPSYQALYHPRVSAGKRRPTTGGTWEAFDPDVDWTYVGHTYVGDLLDAGIVGQEWWDGVFKFAFVRNTYKRLVSLFEFERTRRFRRTRGHWTNKHLLHFHDYIYCLTSGEIDPRKPSDAEPWPPMQGHKQLPWLDRGVDYVGRFEHIDEDWQKLCSTVGIEYKPLKHRNKPHTHLDFRPRLEEGWRGYYTAELRDRVAEFYADEIERFGFMFDD